MSFKNITKNTIHNLRLYFNLLITIIMSVYAYISNRHTYHKSLPSVYFCLFPSHNHIRLHLPYLFYFHKAGYNVFIRPTLRLLTYQDENFGLFTYLWVNIKFRVPKNTSVIITDSEKIKERYKITKDIHVTLIKPDDNREHLQENENRISFMMHPTIYTRSWNKLIDYQNKSKIKDIKIFFAGNLDPKIYNSQIIKSKFRINNRHEIFETLKNNFFNDSIWIETWEEKIHLQNITKPIVIVNSFLAGLSHEEYFNLLARSEFVISPPGVRYPYCHNLPESLAFNCIPIIQFPDLSSPMLTKGITCLKYKNLKQLIEIINVSLNMNEESKQFMQSNIMSLYKAEYGISNVIMKFLISDLILFKTDIPIYKN